MFTFIEQVNTEVLMFFPRWVYFRVLFWGYRVKHFRRDAWSSWFVFPVSFYCERIYLGWDIGFTLRWQVGLFITLPVELIDDFSLAFGIARDRLPF